jgi:hypothetical protein
VFDVYRHGIVHGTVSRFDNVVVATKAWKMLFAVADWAAATTKAQRPPKRVRLPSSALSERPAGSTRNRRSYVLFGIPRST